MVKSSNNPIKEKAILSNHPALALRKKMLPQPTQHQLVAKKMMQRKLEEKRRHLRTFRN